MDCDFCLTLLEATDVFGHCHGSAMEVIGLY